MSKIGFCFTGEGARGAVQAGIALALHNRGIDADFTTGTSSGSYCAACYSYNGPEKMAEMWRTVKNIFHIFGINWGFLWKTGFLNQKPAAKLIYEMVKNKPLCDCEVLKMHIETAEVQFVKNTNVSPEEFAEGVLGAFAVTSLVETRNGWVDAGSRVMTPLKRCVEEGCDDIYVIMGRPFAMPQWKTPRGICKWAWLGYRALDISLFELLSRDINSCLKKNGEPGFKNIKIHLMQPKELPYDSMLFRKCAMGVEYGLNEHIEIHETGMLKSLISR